MQAQQLVVRQAVDGALPSQHVAPDTRVWLVAQQVTWWVLLKRCQPALQLRHWQAPSQHFGLELLQLLLLGWQARGVQAVRVAMLQSMHTIQLAAESTAALQVRGSRRGGR